MHKLEIENYARSFWENGYLVLENFFSPRLMEYLNQVVINHFGMNPDWEHNDEFINKSKTEVVPWFPFREGNRDFVAVEEDQRLLDLTEEVLGSGWQNLYCMAMFSKAGTKGQAWHQDSPPEDGRKFNLNRLFYTHDITEETGGEIIIAPKTHIEQPLTSGAPDEDLENQLVLRPKKGTLVLLHGHAWHRVLPVGEKFRVSVNSRAIPKGTPEDITDIAVYRNMRYKFSTREVIN